MSRALDRVALLAFLLALLFLAFGYGYAAKTFKIFPQQQIDAAIATARSFYVAYLRRPPMDRAAPEGWPEENTATIHNEARLQPGVTLIAAYRPEGFEAWLVDRNGARLHTWRARFSEVFTETPHLRWQARDQVIAWQGMHLFPNGDLLFNFQDWSFPYGSGLVRLNRNSEVVWKLPRNTHHDIAMTGGDDLWVPAHDYRTEISEDFPHLLPGYYEDTALRVSVEGEVLEEFSVYQSLKNYPGLFSITYHLPREVEQEDPLHLNGIEALPAAIADEFELFEAGDLLVSLRNINTIAVLDGSSKMTKWVLTGPFVRQHEADFMPNGNILVYDNQGARPECGETRVMEIAPSTQDIVWQYSGCEDEEFYSQTRGMAQLLENGNVLTVEPHGGRALEVTRDESPELVWEYFNVFTDDDEELRVGVMLHAERYDRSRLRFLDDTSQP